MNSPMTTKELLALVEEARLTRVGYDCQPGTVRWRRVCEAEAAAKDAAYAALPALCAEVEALEADLAACHRYVAARDAFDYAAEKYGDESNCAAMKPVRREVLAAVKEYRAVLAKEPK